ncbi:MAG TPA: PorV/PorQ family protein [bacterium]|nr:PorV/PorQ family protein [bacterium]
MKKIIKFTLIMALAVVCSWNTGKAQVGLEKVGQSTMNFLKVGVSPTAASLGNAFTTIGTGAESVFYNPSGIAQVSNISAFLSNTMWIADINYTAAAVAKRFGTIGSFGLNVLSVDYGDITQTQLLSAADPQGYREVGPMDIGAFGVGLSYARQISNQFSMGGQIQYVGQTLGTTGFDTGEQKNQMRKLTLNFGMKFNTGYKGFQFAMAVRNFSSAAQYEEVSAQLPLVFMSGVAIDLLDVMMPGHSENTSLMVASEFLHPNNFTERVNFGAEYQLGIISVRGGYEHNRDLGGLSAGFGLTPEIGNAIFGINYSYSAMAVFDGVNRFSLVAAF